MLLHDIGKSPNSTFRRINQHLELNYGFKISEDVSDKDLDLIMEQIEGEITELKIKGDDAKTSAEISKRLLVLEGIRSLSIFEGMVKTPKHDSIIQSLVDHVVNEFHNTATPHNAQMAFDDAIKDAMKAYRACECTMPDDYIEQTIRQKSWNEINPPEMSEPMDMPDQLPTDPYSENIAVIGEAGSNIAWDSMGKRASARGGHSADIPDTEKARQIAKALDNPKLSLAPKDTETDPWKAQAERRRQGIVHTEGKEMKEHANLVKNLRRLLETEVSQAEVMMAAKGFAQELQEMVEKIGRLQNEDLPPVTDQMRETYGMESASAFQTQIYGALQSVMDALYTAKQQVDDAVGNMASTGQVTAQTDMDKDIGMDDGMDGMDGGTDNDMGDADLDLDNIGDELSGEPGDDFGGEEALGREKKMESVLQKKVMEMKKLVAKAKKLREAKK